MNEQPLVSALVTSYNYAQFLPACLASITEQSYPNIEIIIVDDGSTDGSRALLEAWKPRANVIFQQNAGQLGAFETGFAAVRGEIVCLIDADDVWDPDKVARVVRVFTEHPRVSWLRHNLRMVDEALRPLDADSIIGPPGLVPPHHALIAERVISASTSGLVLRTALARRVFPLRAQASRFRYDADAVLLARCVALDAWGYSIAEPLGSYRRHGAQQYASASDVIRLLERQLEVGSAVCHELGTNHPPLVSRKLRAVLAAVRGERFWSHQRAGAIAAGLLTMRPLFAQPRLLLRQLAALAWAVAAPNTWLRSFSRKSGLAAR